MSRRRYLCFSLRALLVVLTVFAIWLGWHCNGVRRQRAAVKGIQDYGGWVYYDFQGFTADRGITNHQAESWVPEPILNALGVDFFHSVIVVNLNFNDDQGKRLVNANLTDDALPYLAGLPKLRGLYLHKTQASDEGMRHVGQLKQLESLLIWDADLSDLGVIELQGLPKLRYLHVSNSRITDESFRTFNTFPRIKHLSLQGNNFTDAAFKHLDYKPTLTSMWVGLGKQNDITDAAIKYILRQQSLEELELQDTNVTAEGLSRLAGLTKLKSLVVTEESLGDLSALVAAMPNCAIE